MECEKCYRDGGAGPWCEETCQRPECGPCFDERYFAAHPIEAARFDYEEAEARAQWAYEAGHEDWRELAAEAEEAADWLWELEEEALGGQHA